MTEDTLAVWSAVSSSEAGEGLRQSELTFCQSKLLVSVFGTLRCMC